MAIVLLPRARATAAVGQYQAWSLIYSGVGFPGTLSYSVGTAGDRRLLVVAVSSTINAAVSQTASVTYGKGGLAQNMTLQIGDAASSTQAHTYLFYLVDDDFGDERIGAGPYHLSLRNTTV